MIEPVLDGAGRLHIQPEIFSVSYFPVESLHSRRKKSFARKIAENFFDPVPFRPEIFLLVIIYKNSYAVGQMNEVAQLGDIIFLAARIPVSMMIFYGFGNAFIRKVPPGQAVSHFSMFVMGVVETEVGIALVQIKHTQIVHQGCNNQHFKLTGRQIHGFAQPQRYICRFFVMANHCFTYQVHGSGHGFHHRIEADTGTFAACIFGCGAVVIFWLIFFRFGPHDRALLQVWLNSSHLFSPVG